MSNNTDFKNDEANLIGNSIAHDDMIDKAKKEYKDDVKVDSKNMMEEIMKNLDKLPATETDMNFQYFANPDKLVPPDKIQYFDKSQSYNNDKSRDSEKYNYHQTESLNDYTKNDYTKSESKNDNRQRTETRETSNIMAPKGGSYGPSYGEGPSFATEQPPVEDRYYGFGSEEELNLAKLDMLRKLGELTQHGVKLSQNYNMKSDYKAMKYEYDLHRSIKDKHNGVKWLSNLLLNVTYGMEIANEAFNPFEFKLKGWSEQMNEDIDDYYDVLGELYEKYFKAGKPVPPELKLMFMMGASAVKFHIAHTALGKIPSLTEAMAQNPELAKKLNEQAIANKIKEQHDKHKETFDNKLEEQQQNARKKAEELQMLKDKQTEILKSQQQSQQAQQQFMQQQQMQQQFMQQQMMEQQVMQQQLLTKQRQLESLQKQLNLQRSDTKSMYTNTSEKKSRQQQKMMSRPVVPDSLKNKFSVTRKTQSSTSNPLDDFNKVQMNPDFEDIINDSLNDNQSMISDNDSRASKDSKNSRKRKPVIRINT